MYAICVEYYGKYGAIIPAGNDGKQKLHNKTRRGWLSETECMRRDTTGNVYVIADFIQKMCEMSPRELVNDVQNNYITIL